MLYGHFFHNFWRRLRRGWLRLKGLLVDDLRRGNEVVDIGETERDIQFWTTFRRRRGA